MLRYKCIAVVLALVVAVLCPVACGLASVTTGESTSVVDCCGRVVQPGEAPEQPPQPVEKSPGDCFCSTTGVISERVDASHIQVVTLYFVADVVDEGAPILRLSRITPDSFAVRPPDPRRPLPLLI